MLPGKPIFVVRKLQKILWQLAIKTGLATEQPSGHPITNPVNLLV